MAILTAIFQLIYRRLGDLIQAVFGWSVAALFGKRAAAKSTALSVALALSVLWPFFVLGIFVPAAISWLLAFLPLNRWMGDTALRVLWGVLALVAPLIVGGITRWAAGARVARGSALRTVIGGYPLTLGYAVAFLITLFTVPAMKVATFFKRWSEEHAYVQPREGAYDAVLHSIAAGFVGAGLTPTIEPVPRSMSLATEVIKRLARGFIQPMMPDEPRRVRAEGVEVYLYPSDLVLRGETKKVARVRAELMSTSIDRHAYLVADEKAQKVQDEVQRLWDVVVHHEKERHALGGMANVRVREMLDELRKVDLPFDEWASLERMVRRLERRIGESAESRERDRKAARVEAAMESDIMNPEPLEEAPVSVLINDAIRDARELIRVEVELAKVEVKKEAKAATRAAIGFGAAAAAAVVALSLLGVAIVLALGGSALVALAVAGGFFAVAAIVGVIAYNALPKNPMEETRARVQSDVQQIKESLA